jgi:amino acid adenylation domain-containing protein
MQTARWSSQQRHAWRTWASGHGSALQAVITLDGPADTGRLCRACVTVLARHEILRTRHEDDGSGFARAAADDVAAGGADGTDGAGTEGVTAVVVNAVIPPVCDLMRMSSDACDVVLRRSLRHVRQSHRSQSGQHQPVALLPAMSVLLLRSSVMRHLVVLTASPLIADARTCEICAREIVDAYLGVASGQGLTYADVRVWQEELLAEADAAAGRQYWLEQRGLAVDPASLPFEVSPAIPAAGKDDGPGGCVIDIDIDVTGSAGADAVAGAARERGCTTAAFWLACWQAFCGRVFDGALSTMGMTFDGRTYGELADVAGPLDPVVPVRWLASPPDTVEHTAKAVDALLRAHAEWLEYFASADFVPVPWRVGFAYVHWPALRRDGDGELTARLLDTVVDGGTGAPLTLTVHEHDDAGWRVQLHYDPRRFAAATVRQFGRWLMTLVTAAAADPGARWDELPWLTTTERQQIAGTWNETTVAWPADAGETLVAWTERQLPQAPDAVAVWSEAESWSYAHLHAEANRIARRLRQLDVGTEARVGIWLHRSPRLVAALLGVLKAGAAYVPLDPTYPAARLAVQIADAQVRVVITDRESAAAVPAGSYAVEVLDAPDAAWRTAPAAPVPVSIAAAQLAYIIYTSGSTGTPKGVMNAHAAVLNGLFWMQAAFGLSPADRVLQKTSISFDVSVWELFGALGTGATVILARSGGQQDPSYLADLIVRTGVTVTQFVPAMLDAFVTAGGFAAPTSLRLVANCGEALPGGLVGRTRAEWPGRFENLYGPTEAAVEVTSHSCGPTDALAGIVPIGRPLANTRMFIVDRAGLPVPPHVVGHLLIGGAQVGRGYWARPDVTAARFIPDAFGTRPGARLYRTGDLARYRPGGVIEYVGRADHQVKLAGHRIELGEIGAVLRRQPGVRDAVVVVRDDAPGERRLVAYVVPTIAGERPDGESLKGALRMQLPDAWVPAAIVPLDALPLMPNGKVDRRRLPEPDAAEPRPAVYVPPSTETETALAAIWAEVLRVERVGVTDNFFALGGDSILSLQIVARAMRAGWRLAPRQVFEHPTVAQLAAVASTAMPTVASTDAPTTAPTDAPTAVTVP